MERARNRKGFMADTKAIFLFLSFLFLSLGAWAEAPRHPALAGLRQEIMSMQPGPAKDETVRRVLSYREDDQTLLLHASLQGDVALIARLAQVLPDTRVFQAKDRLKRNAFHLAASYDTALELMKTYAVLRGRETQDMSDVFDRRAFKTALINAGDLRSETPLMAQVRAKRYDVAFLYLTKNADLNRKTVAGDTVMHMLVRQCAGNNPQALDLLQSFLNGEPYSVFLRDGKDRTPLDLAHEIRARVAFEKIKEVQQTEQESRARNIRIALRNFFTN